MVYGSLVLGPEGRDSSLQDLLSLLPKEERNPYMMMSYDKPTPEWAIRSESQSLQRSLITDYSNFEGD